MPFEARHIYFSEFELISALVSFSKLKKKYFEKGDVQSVIIGNGATVDVSLVVEPPHADSSEIVDYKYAEVAAALIAFCMRNNVPLPRSAKKELQAKNDQVYLSMTLDVKIY